MHYIQLIELESIQATSCKIKGLPQTELMTLEKDLEDLQIYRSHQPNFLEIDTEGVKILNLLSNRSYMYKVYGQSMTIEKSNIGGRTAQVQITAWTLGKEIN